MQKICCCFLGAAMAISLLPLSSCGGGEAKNRYEIKAEYLAEEEILRCEMTVTVVNKSENAYETLPFQLWANAYREGAVYPPISELYAPAAYYDGESYGGITLSSVEGGTFTVGGEDLNLLCVTPEEPLYPDESLTLGMHFDVKLAHINHRLGIGERAVNLSGFYPILCAAKEGGFLECVYSENGDPFVSECADYSVQLTVPSAYDVAGAMFCSEEGGKRVFELQAENVRDVAFVLSDSFNRSDGEVNGVSVSYYALEDNPSDPTLSVACEALSFCGERFGAYPHSRYTVVQTDFPYGGMEYPMLSMISASLTPEQIPAVVAHETAHQWWYGLVGSNQFEEAWQDEGLAEWTTALFLESYPQYGGSYRDMVNAAEKAYRAYFSVSEQLNGEANTCMSRPLTSYSGLYEYRSIAYDKAVILFDRICDVAGEKKLLKGLKNYAARYGGKIAAPADLIACLTDAGAHVGELVLSFTEGRCVI